jgi:hypothetical protein
MNENIISQNLWAAGKADLSVNLIARYIYEKRRKISNT